MKIEQNCIINGMPAKVYHADPCPTPSLSSSMASALLNETEEEAMLASRRINPNYEEEEGSDSMDFGTLGHDFILKGARGTYEVVPYDDFRTADAKAMRDHIQARGLIALNRTTEARCVDKLNAMKLALRRQLDDHRDWSGLMVSGKAEQAIFAKDGDIWLRAMADWLDDKYPDVVVDYKTTAQTFDKWERDLWAEDKIMQNPHYLNTISLASGRQYKKFIWVVQRTVAPYQIVVVEYAPEVMEDVLMRYSMAKLRFSRCLKTGIWRGQPPYTRVSYPPKWIMDKWDMQALTFKEEMKAPAEPDKGETGSLLMAG